MDLEKRELWKKRMLDFKSSGLSGVKWCKQQGIPPHQLTYWKKALLEKESTRMPSWMPVTVVDEEQIPLESSLTVRVGSVEIEVKRGYDATLLQDVVRMLMGLC